MGKSFLIGEKALFIGEFLLSIYVLQNHCHVFEKYRVISQYKKTQLQIMKATCQHCQRQCKVQDVANAHTVYEREEGEVTFSSTDDNSLGIDICQVCYKPPFLARVWFKITGHAIKINQPSINKKMAF